MKRYIVAASVAALGIAGFAQGARINEVRIDQQGGDTDEYFELSGTPFESLDGLWYIVIGDHSSAQGNPDPGSRSGNVEFAINLTGSTIPADGFFLAASTTFGATLSGSVDLPVTFAFPNSFENGDNVTHMLVRDFSGLIGDALEIGQPDGTIDITPWSAVIDSISFIEKLTPDFESDEFNYAGQFGPGIGPDGTFVPAHIYRSNDGSSPWAIGLFGDGTASSNPTNGNGPFDSPGTSNIPTPGAFALLGLAGLAGTRRRR